MCAMKEVTLFSDDAKSRESAQQLGHTVEATYRLTHQRHTPSIYKVCHLPVYYKEP